MGLGIGFCGSEVPRVRPVPEALSMRLAPRVLCDSAAVHALRRIKNRLREESGCTHECSELDGDAFRSELLRRHPGVSTLYFELTVDPPVSGLPNVGVSRRGLTMLLSHRLAGTFY